MAIFGLRSGYNIFYVRWGAKLADKGNQLAPGGSGKFDALKGCRRTSCQVGFPWLDGHMENGHFYSNTLINLTFWGIFGAGRVIFVPEGSKIQSWSANFIKKSGKLYIIFKCHHQHSWWSLSVRKGSQLGSRSGSSGEAEIEKIDGYRIFRKK